MIPHKHKSVHQLKMTTKIVICATTTISLHSPARATCRLKFPLDADSPIRLCRLPQYFISAQPRSEHHLVVPFSLPLAQYSNSSHRRKNTLGFGFVGAKGEVGWNWKMDHSADAHRTDLMTLTRFVLNEQSKYPESRGDFTILLNHIVLGCKFVCSAVNKVCFSPLLFLLRNCLKVQSFLANFIVRLNYGIYPFA